MGMEGRGYVANPEAASLTGPGYTWDLGRGSRQGQSRLLGVGLSKAGPGSSIDRGAQELKTVVTADSLN